ncbi:hypothetical protein C0992_006163 [Termitomyces sp. T32_za158]|nr:hypothetical protein C0992_006163 [Termitomyces sp. T32_za158]
MVDISSGDFVQALTASRGTADRDVRFSPDYGAARGVPRRRPRLIIQFAITASFGIDPVIPQHQFPVRILGSLAAQDRSSRSMPVARDKLLSDYPAAFRWTAPASRPEDNDWESGDEVQGGIGNLGQRRGFKGNPLTVRKWSQSSSFLSLPRGLNLTPGSSSRASLDGSFPPSPRTPLEAMASRMRSVSVSVVSWSSGSKTPLPEVTQDLQELYDASDPFASPGNTFFASTADTNAVSLYDPCQLEFYRNNGMARKRSCMAKNVPPQDVLHSAFTNARMKTTIYDLSTADIVPARIGAPVTRKTLIASMHVPESDIADGITAANSPTIVLTAPSSLNVQQADQDETTLAEELPVEVELPERVLEEREGPGKGSRPALAAIGNTASYQEAINKLTTPQPAHVVSVLPAPGCFSNNDFANVQLPAFPYAEFPKVVYETCRLRYEDALVPFPGCADTMAPCSDSPSKQRSSLRPLVLPARVASRLSARIVPVLEDGTGRSQKLDGIIALLDVATSTQDI